MHLNLRSDQRRITPILAEATVPIRRSAPQLPGIMLLGIMHQRDV